MYHSVVNPLLYCACTNIKQNTLLSGIGKMILLAHSLSNEKISSTNKHYTMVLWAKSVYYKCFYNIHRIKKNIKKHVL